MVHVFQMGQFMTKKRSCPIHREEGSSASSRRWYRHSNRNPIGFLVADPIFFPVQPMEDGKFFQSEGKIFFAKAEQAFMSPASKSASSRKARTMLSSPIESEPSGQTSRRIHSKVLGFRPTKLFLLCGNTPPSG